MNQPRQSIDEINATPRHAGLELGKPKMLLLRYTRPDLPAFIRKQLHEHVLCLSQYFEVVVSDSQSCDYQQLCETHEPDIAMFESAVSVGHMNVDNVTSHPAIPKIGFINCDAYCHSRKRAIYDMARWDVSTFFGIAVSLGSYTPSIANQLFVWPNFVNPEVYRDYRLPKVIPVLFSGSQASHYPWRSRIDRVVSQRFPALHSPHFGWSSKKGKPSATGFLEGEKYAQLINSAWVAPTCGTIANEVVRKHFEIPACNTCLITQRTAALEAAGFVDMVNCVFADETDVLDKLEWLFEEPDELARITSAGKQLVDSQHTMQQRDQVFQWFTLHKKLKPGQKMVQAAGPFAPLTIVEENSGVNNRHVESAGIDRLLMDQADDHLRSGKFNDAENLYRRCLNYHQPDVPEHRFRLILCLLYRGKFKEALASVREHFPIHRLNSKKGFEPDPTEWAWFILVLLCCGKNREAALRSEQFIAVHNEELHRVRCMVRTLSGRKNESANDVSHTGHRASVHQPLRLSIEEWLEDVAGMLRACGQIDTVNRLAIANSKLQLLAADQSSKNQSHGDTTVTGLKRASHNSVRKQLAKRRPIGDVALEYYLAASNRLQRSAQKTKLRLLRLTSRISAQLPHRSPSIAEDEQAAIVRLLQKEEIKSGVFIGAANGSWLSDVFMRGITANPNRPSAVCVNCNTPDFRKFHGRFVDSPNVEFRYAPDEGGCLSEANENADVIAFNCSDIPSDARHVKIRANLVLLEQINNATGSELFRAMQSDENYLLVLQEAFRCDGYAIFRKVAAKTSAMAA